MFDRTWFYHKGLRKILTCFGTIFDNLTVKRIDSNGDVIEEFKVPLTYGPKEKYVYRTTQDPDIVNREVQSIYPRMTFEMQALYYDGDRKLPKLEFNVKETDNQTLLKQLQPVPYNLKIKLSIISKYTDTAYQIVEQILPFFTPNLTVQYVSIPELDLHDDLHVNLDNVSFSDNWDGNFTEKREIIWDLNFTVNAFFYGPIEEQGIIREIIVNTHTQIPEDPDTGEIDGSLEALHKIPRVMRVTITPDPANANPDDPYEIVETFENFDDGKRYDPITGTDVDVDP